MPEDNERIIITPKSNLVSARSPFIISTINHQDRRQKRTQYPQPPIADNHQHHQPICQKSWRTWTTIILSSLNVLNFTISCPQLILIAPLPQYSHVTTTTCLVLIATRKLLHLQGFTFKASPSSPSRLHPQTTHLIYAGHSNASCQSTRFTQPEKLFNEKVPNLSGMGNGKNG